MDSRAIQKLAAELSAGRLPDSQPWDIAAAVQLLIDRVAAPASSLGIEDARAAARILNRRLHFHLAAELARAWQDRHGFDATIAKHRAQALINLSSLDEADTVLTAGLAAVRVSLDHDSGELAEYEGLLGRVWKQRFVRSNDRRALATSIGHYRAQYESNPARPFWHGINVAALLARQEREGWSGTGSAASIAQSVYETVAGLERKGQADQWAYATASEACLALGKCEEAELWLHRFLQHPELQPFDADSYARQLREVWRGEATGTERSCANRLSAILERHIARTQGRWSVAPASVEEKAKALERDPAAYEKNFAGEASFSLGTLKRMLGACASIGCVCNRTGERLGTGFLVSGEKLKESYGVAPLFVTNAHVIGKDVPNAIPAREARVTFEVESGNLRNPRYYEVDEVLFSSPPGDLGFKSPSGDHLDVSVVRLKGLSSKFTVLRSVDTLPLVDGRSKAFVVGHPRGSGLQIALHDSVLLDIDDDGRLVHYRTPTDPGSSGSPVFNTEFDVIAIHHGGSRSTPRLRGAGTYEANEGISLAAVRRRLHSISGREA